MGLVEGDFWPRSRDVSVLYRGLDSVDRIDLERPVAVLEGEGELALPDWLEHPVGRDVWYLLRRVSVTGRQENNTVSVVGVRRDSDGVIRPLTRGVISTREDGHG